MGSDMRLVGVPEDDGVFPELERDALGKPDCTLRCVGVKVVDLLSPSDGMPESVGPAKPLVAGDMVPAMACSTPTVAPGKPDPAVARLDVELSRTTEPIADVEEGSSASPASRVTSSSVDGGILATDQRHSSD